MVDPQFLMQPNLRSWRTSESGVKMHNYTWASLLISVGWMLIGVLDFIALGPAQKSMLASRVNTGIIGPVTAMPAFR